MPDEYITPVLDCDPVHDRQIFEVNFWCPLRRRGVLLLAQDPRNRMKISEQDLTGYQIENHTHNAWFPLKLLPIDCIHVGDLAYPSFCLRRPQNEFLCMPI